MLYQGKKLLRIWGYIFHILGEEMKKFCLKSTLLVLFFVYTSSAAYADTYQIDGAHSGITFKIKHLGISTVTGSFGDFSGEFKFDKDKVAESSVKANIDVKSIDTRNSKRDSHLLEADFFDQPKFPQISFVSKEIRKVKGDEFEIVGDLTMHGMTKEVVLETELSGEVTDSKGTEVVSFSAETKLDRTDFGLKYGKLMEAGGLVIGHEVKIQLDITGKKVAEAMDAKKAG